MDLGYSTIRYYMDRVEWLLGTLYAPRQQRMP
jgi:hypothetical protein